MTPCLEFSKTVVSLDRAEYAEAEVVRLKAKLYDLLVERKEVV